MKTQIIFYVVFIFTLIITTCINAQNGFCRFDVTAGQTVSDGFAGRTIGVGVGFRWKGFENRKFEVSGSYSQNFEKKQSFVPGEWTLSDLRVREIQIGVGACQPIFPRSTDLHVAVGVAGRKTTLKNNFFQAGPCASMGISQKIHTNPRSGVRISVFAQISGNFFSAGDIPEEKVSDIFGWTSSWGIEISFCKGHSRAWRRY